MLLASVADSLSPGFSDRFFLRHAAHPWFRISEQGAPGCQGTRSRGQKT
jgi:hypothetical protein